MTHVCVGAVSSPFLSSNFQKPSSANCRVPVFHRSLGVCSPELHPELQSDQPATTYFDDDAVLQHSVVCIILQYLSSSPVSHFRPNFSSYVVRFLLLQTLFRPPGLQGHLAQHLLLEAPVLFVSLYTQAQANERKMHSFSLSGMILMCHSLFSNLASQFPPTSSHQTGFLAKHLNFDFPSIDCVVRSVRPCALSTCSCLSGSLLSVWPESSLLRTISRCRGFLCSCAVLTVRSLVWLACAPLNSYRLLFRTHDCPTLHHRLSSCLDRACHSFNEERNLRIIICLQPLLVRRPHWLLPLR